MRFLFNVKCRKRNERKKIGHLTSDEVEDAENVWIHCKQQESYNNVAQMKTLKRSFGVYKDSNNILRCKGKSNYSDLAPMTCNPILLAKG